MQNLPFCRIIVARTSVPAARRERKEGNSLARETREGRTHAGLYIRAMAKWLAVALVTGCCCGVVGSLFHIGVELATELREQHPWLL